MNRLFVKDFSLKRTLECGQIFRYSLFRGFYYLVVKDCVLKLRQEGDFLFYSSSRQIEKSSLRSLLGLDHGYKSLIQDVSKDRFMKNAIASSYGVRIMRQDPWECMMSYICSANMSVKGVKRQVDSLAKKFGNKIEFDGLSFYSFPEKLGSLKQIMSCGVGFRAKSIFEAGSVKRDWLLSLKRKSYSDAKKELVKLRGVGEKVADCILLYSLGFSKAFPIDRWIRRAVQDNYFNSKKVSAREMRSFVESYFGSNAGYAQLFMYSHIREQIRIKTISCVLNRFLSRLSPY